MIEISRIPNKDESLRAVELFAGVGGFRCGLDSVESGSVFDTVWSNQWEPGAKKQFASEIYQYVYGSEGHVNNDINSSLNLIPKHDVLLAGFPCQDYSVAKRLDQSKGIVGDFL